MFYLQDLSAPATPPQAHSSRLGASEAGRQGRGRAAAAEGGEQPPSRQEPAMQQANPYRSLGESTPQTTPAPPCTFKMITCVLLSSN
jgi:hypothetical protein